MHVAKGAARLALTGFALVMTAQAPAATARDFPVAATPVLEDRFPIVAVDFPGGVKAYRDIVYQQAAPFAAKPVVLAKLATRYGGTQWARGPMI